MYCGLLVSKPRSGVPPRLLVSKSFRIRRSSESPYNLTRKVLLARRPGKSTVVGVSLQGALQSIKGIQRTQVLQI